MDLANHQARLLAESPFDTACGLLRASGGLPFVLGSAQRVSNPVLGQSKGMQSQALARVFLLAMK